ncbi:phytoene desaturase family protein [Olivibacter sitiensis]|uniref:phytoene desaturase family protein n=1 Tax=Olivibacter sitiensis TaxID=376470 RepID=UPI0004270C76|nr:phytoene desaturase family protein [Olivibacter sitiensis]
MHSHVTIIGAGLAGLVASCYLRKCGFEVSVVEKNATPGGRARQFSEKGFVFDMGPSWYWMPDVFESFFADFGKKTSDYYKLVRLSPSYTVFFENEEWDIPSSMEELGRLFETLETGSRERLQAYMHDAAAKYAVGMHRFASKPALHLSEFMSGDILSLLHKLQPFRNMEQHVNRYFSHPLIRKIMQFPVIFLGAMPHRIPAMYSLMNYADTRLGTWYPLGGMHEIVKAVYKLAKALGVKFRFGADVAGIDMEDKKARAVRFNNERLATDIVIGAGDYHGIESLLPEDYRQYDNRYWESREMAPSCLLYFLGIDKRLPLQHHSLFFDTSFEGHGKALYQDPEWPKNPLFYVCAPSVTDPSVAPEGCENLFVLIPVAAGLDGDTAAMRREYLDMVLKRLEERTKTDIKNHIVFQKDYAISDFQQDYHAFKGNAYGLANTLMQTAFGKPRMHSRKVENLFFCGQLTVPGPGLPPAFLSGKMVAEQVLKYAQQKLDFSTHSTKEKHEYPFSVQPSEL